MLDNRYRDVTCWIHPTLRCPRCDHPLVVGGRYVWCSQGPYLDPPCDYGYDLDVTLDQVAAASAGTIFREEP